MKKQLDNWFSAAKVPREGDKMKRFVMFTAFLLGGVSSFAATIDVPVTLNVGWNAIYVPVGSEAKLEELFGDWPVPSISMYSAESILSTVTTAGGLTGETASRVPFLIWSKEVPAVSSLSKLVADSVLVCCNTGTTVYTGALRGVPVAPRIAWHLTEDGGDAYNYVGVRLNDSAKVNAADYFAGCEAASNSDYYKLSGKSEGAYKISKMGGFSSSSVASLVDGQVVLVKGSGASNWSGPLYVTPQEGLEFGEDGTKCELEIRNDGAAAKNIKLKMIPSTTETDKAMVLLLQDKDEQVINPDWQELKVGGTEFVKTLGTGATWRVSLALDRTKLENSGEELGAILEIAEDGGTEMRVDIPVTAMDKVGVHVWPCGLWAFDLELNKVTRYVKDTQKVEDVKAGGTMKLRIYAYVTDEGSAVLLPRVTIVGVKNSDFTVTRTAYGPGVTLPMEMDYGRRLSSAALPVDIGAVAASSDSVWGKSVKFNYTIGTKSGSNPFRHPLHPMFDGKDANFDELTYDGDDFDNYAKTVKPELFSIGGEVNLNWEGSTGSAWSPEETTKGTCSWIYTGLMRQGPVRAAGTFTAERVVPAIDFIGK